MDSLNNAIKNDTGDEAVYALSLGLIRFMAVPNRAGCN